MKVATRHELKISDKYIDEVWAGKKTAEVRKNDRDFVVGDLLDLQSPNSYCVARVTHILTAEDLAKVGILIEPTAVVLSICVNSGDR